MALAPSLTAWAMRWAWSCPSSCGGVRQSIRIVRQALDGLPEGPISSRPGVKSVAQVRVPKGEGYTRIEGARGEIGCYIVSDGGPKPYRLKWRGASFSNLAVLPHIRPIDGGIEHADGWARRQLRFPHA